MDPLQVRPHNWRGQIEPGVNLIPKGDPLRYWTIQKIHARYEALHGDPDAKDPWGQPIPPQKLLAYIVDLVSDNGLPDADGVVLYQQPPVSNWWIKEADDAYLAKIERWRVQD